MAAGSQRIVDIKAIPTSFPVDPKNSVTLGIGRAVKRDAVMVKVTTEDGIVGWGEAHHGRAPGSVAHLINNTLKQLVVGQDANDVIGVWAKVYEKQLGSHGMGAAACIGLSGIDQALWDVRGKALGAPLYKLLGGRAKRVPAYAGGVSLGYQDPDALIAEAQPHIAAGYKAIKLRVGDTPSRDIARVAAVREALGDDIAILVDANTGYTVADARKAMPAFEDYGVGWLEEPFPPHDHFSYAQTASFSSVPLAAGENHYTRFEFHRLAEDRVITVWQPDLSKSGGVTECLRIAHLASAWKIPINPHTSMTGINMAVTIHFLCAIDNAGYFEGDVSKSNLFRDELVSTPYTVGADGCVAPLDKPGIGVEVNEAFLAAHPVIEGPAYV
ncbi:MAG TPA: mandelate racemase/muconate lactonizing enzyme family protein [Burkholderiales bacterium]|nr:mandelate racemase/muconate lactonizing enzyme family protein [Burkholderiales bacterium]